MTNLKILVKSILILYAPGTEKEIEKLYSTLEKAKAPCKSQEITFIMGDLIAKITKARDDENH